MNGAGAAVLAVAALVAGGVFAALVLFATFRSRGGEASRSLRVARRAAFVEGAVLAAGLLLPKSLLRSLAFETSGRVLLGAVAAVAAVAAFSAVTKRERGAGPWFVCHALLVVVCATVAGEGLFALFFMM